MRCTTTKKGAILDVTRYSKLPRLLRVTAWIERFKCISSLKHRRNGPKAADELQFSEGYWIRQTQNKVFYEKCFFLKRKHTLPENSEVSLLPPYIDHAGILRVGGRLESPRAEVDVQQSIILNTSNDFPIFVVMNVRSPVFHSRVASAIRLFGNVSGCCMHGNS